MAALCLLASSFEKKGAEKCWMKKLFNDRVNYCDTKLLNVIDEDEYRNYLRMDNSTFSLLLEKVGPLISKKRYSHA